MFILQRVPAELVSHLLLKGEGSLTARALEAPLTPESMKTLPKDLLAHLIYGRNKAGSPLLLIVSDVYSLRHSTEA